jgi:carbamoyl-phosphate synthase large subunit
VLAVGADKLRTCRWLAEHGFPVPHYAASGDRRSVAELVAACGYPLIAKPRQGRGMHGVFMVDDADDLAYATRRRDYLLQEYLADGDAEFTAGCFSDRDGQVRGTIVLRRELLQGTTYRAEAGPFPQVRAAAAAIAGALRPLGPCNAQFRVDRGCAVCFEINVRFSGSTPLRARFGFNEVEAALRHYVLGEPAVDLPVITQGLATRYWNEVYVDPAAHAELVASGALDNPEHYGSYQESYGPRPRSSAPSEALSQCQATS